MKNSLVSFIILSIFSSSGLACEVYDSIGTRQGKVEAGVIYQNDGAVAGRVFSGEVYDVNRQALGTVKNGTIYATDRYVLGRIVSGAVYDPQGALLMKGFSCTSNDLGAAALIFALN